MTNKLTEAELNAIRYVAEHGSNQSQYILRLLDEHAELAATVKELEAQFTEIRESEALQDDDAAPSTQPTFNTGERLVEVPLPLHLQDILGDMPAMPAMARCGSFTINGAQCIRVSGHKNACIFDVVTP